MKVQELNPYQYTISLRIWHPNMPHEEISKTIGRTPRLSWTAGSPRFSIKGKPLGGFYDFYYWTERLKPKTVLSDPILVEEEIAQQIALLSHMAVFLRRFVQKVDGQNSLLDSSAILILLLTLNPC